MSGKKAEAVSPVDEVARQPRRGRPYGDPVLTLTLATTMVGIMLFRRHLMGSPRAVERVRRSENRGPAVQGG